LALCSALVNPAWLEGGWKAPTFTRALERLSRLVQDPALQDDPQRLAALTILAAATTGAADPARGRLVGEQLLSMADDADQQTLMLAHWILGLSDWSQGQPVAAREQLERALALYNSEIGSSLSVTLAGDPGMTGDSALAYTVWLLGYPDQSRARFREVLARAQATGQLSNAAHAHLWAGTAHLLLGRDATAARRHAQAVQPFVGGGQFYGAWAELLTVPRGAARPEPARNGDLSEPPPALQTLQSGLGQAARLLAQAKTCAAAGQVEMGLQAVDQALAWIERTGMRIMEVEAWRTRGELLFLVHGPDSDSSEAEACFRRALEVARGQQARWLELQAAVSLARLWQAQGRRDEARELLAPIYNWFTEGFDTVDLIKAKALLDELQ
jgi:tetratricopeptide (TPR) repeat protein